MSRIPRTVSDEMGEWDDHVDKAIHWVLGKLGSPEYRGVCLGFVEDAYELANEMELDGYATARGAAEGYGAAGSAGPPPEGAFVFYDCEGSLEGIFRNWGHVGLCIGDGKVVHAWDVVRTDDYMAVEELTPAPGWTRPNYIGWAPASTIIPHRPTQRESNPLQRSGDADG